MIGAGASLSSGVKPTKQIMEELVGRYGNGHAGSTEDRFDELWRSSNPDDRVMMLNPYLTRPPSQGYTHLAELIRMGFFDTVVTFNFDALLEKALDELGFTDYKTIIRGEHETDVVKRLLASRDKRVKILKLHGSLRSSDQFLFSREEMLNYPKDLEAIVTDLTGRDIIICGYAFNDTCVVRAFSPASDGGSIYFVNPAGAPDSIKGFLLARRSKEKVIAGDSGKFDAFFEGLFRALTAPPPPAPCARKNMFKFLDHYQEEHKNWFLGRLKLALDVVEKVRTATATVYLVGEPKVGKTSFTRAGLIPRLDPAQYVPVYVRCKANLDVQLAAELGARFKLPLDGVPWPDALARIHEAAAPRRVVLSLDQFERTCRAAAESEAASEPIVELMRALTMQADAGVRPVVISTDTRYFWKFVARIRLPMQWTVIDPLSPRQLERIIRHAAKTAGTTLDPSLVTAICEEYGRGIGCESGDRRQLTLTHVQTICYYLAKGFQTTWAGCDALPQGLKAALESIRDESNLMDLLDDLPLEERRLIRAFLKVICDPNGNIRQVLEFIRTHFPEIREDRYPEPIV
jgi:conflict system STAND superfamily ATPase/SIR2-like protein